MNTALDTHGQLRWYPLFGHASVAYAGTVLSSHANREQTDNVSFYRTVLATIQHCGADRSVLCQKEWIVRNVAAAKGGMVNVWSALFSSIYTKHSRASRAHSRGRTGQLPLPILHLEQTLHDRYITEGAIER